MTKITLSPEELSMTRVALTCLKDELEAYLNKFGILPKETASLNNAISTIDRTMEKISKATEKEK